MIAFNIVSRTNEQGLINYANLNEDIIKEHTLIINATPLGAYPNNLSFPDIPYQYLTSKHYLFDLVYNPAITSFMQKGLQQNAYVKNGYEMLVIQAEENWNIWNEIL